MLATHHPLTSAACRSNRSAGLDVTPHPWLSIQPKLRINQPGDQYEQEADRVADQVMRMPEPALRRKCACGGTCDKCKRGHGEEEHGLLQMKRVDASALGPEEAPPIVHEVLQQPGSPLDEGSRKFMEPRLGYDLNSIRLHNDQAAHRSADQVGALAYTVGSHIVLGPDAPSSGSNQGRQLLAHELAHVAQQQVAGAGAAVQRAPAKRAKTRKELDQEMIDRTRKQAVARLSVAYLRINGTNPDFSEREELQRVQGFISPRIENLEQVADMLGRMLSIVASSNIEVGPEIKACSQWVAYVTDNRVPIHLCRKFFSKGDEQGTRTLIHESAHAIGIGQPGAESYFPIYDCSPGTADNWASADAWARYVHCISGATPDQPEKGN